MKVLSNLVILAEHPGNHATLLRTPEHAHAQPNCRFQCAKYSLTSECKHKNLEEVWAWRSDMCLLRRGSTKIQRLFVSKISTNSVGSDHHIQHGSPQIFSGCVFELTCVDLALCETLSLMTIGTAVLRMHPWALAGGQLLPIGQPIWACSCCWNIWNAVVQLGHGSGFPVGMMIMASGHARLM